MNIYESLTSPSFMLNEQVARQVFEVLPEHGPMVLIMDRRGNSWPSNSEEFARLNISEPFLKELCAKIDDGDEPVVTQAEDCSIVAAELATDQNDCGYVIVALPNYTPESTLANIDLIETVLGQFSLIARLIEKNNRLYESQVRHYRTCSPDTTVVN